MKLIDISSGELHNEASLRLTENKYRCTLSAKACELLGLTKDNNKIRFVTTENTPGRLYVCATKRRTGIPVNVSTKDRKAGYIHSKKLYKLLAGKLQGPGLYRICEEDTITDDYDGTVCYGIFFRNLQSTNN